VLLRVVKFGAWGQRRPVPVRVLPARAAFREARQFTSFGLAAYEPALDYPRLLAARA